MSVRGHSRGGVRRDNIISRSKFISPNLSSGPCVYNISYYGGPRAFTTPPPQSAYDVKNNIANIDARWESIDHRGLAESRSVFFFFGIFSPYVFFPHWKLIESNCASRASLFARLWHLSSTRRRRSVAACACRYTLSVTHDRII